MFQKKVFGRRSAESASPISVQPGLSAQPDPYEEMRIIPKEVWDGPLGDHLRQAGFLPDDPQNLELTPDIARAKEDAETARMNRLVAKVNAHDPNVNVAPWALIPWAAWEGLNAKFLIQAGFLPSSPWNNLLLADDAQTSAILGLPEHPRCIAPELVENVKQLVDELRIETQDKIDTCMASISRGDFSALEEYEEIKKEKFQKLFAMARYLIDHNFGPEVRAQHDELFGLGLSAVTDHVEGAA